MIKDKNEDKKRILKFCSISKIENTIESIVISIKNDDNLTVLLAIYQLKKMFLAKKSSKDFYLKNSLV